MAEQQYGPQILVEAQALYQIMKAGKTNYGRREVSDLVSQHVPTLVDTPKFRVALSSLVLQRIGWGRRVFINLLYDLIAGYFGIDAPHDQAPDSPWVAAPAPDPIPVMVHDIFDIDLDNLDVVSPPRTPDSPPWS